MRVRQASGGQGVGFVLLFPVCRLLGPLVQELDPHPHPGGSRTGRARLPQALSQEGLGAEWERTAVRGRIDLASPLAASPPPQSLENQGFWVRTTPALASPVPPCLLPHQGQAFRDQLGAPPHTVLSLSHSVAPMEGKSLRDVLLQSPACSPSKQPVGPSSCLTSSLLAASPVPDSEEMGLLSPLVPHGGSHGQRVLL